MACTVNTSSIHQGQLGEGIWIVTGEATLDALYATGGEVLDISDYVGSDARVVVSQVGVSAYDLAHDGGTAAAGKVMAKHAANGVQTAVNTNLSTVTVSFMAVGSAP